MKRLMIIGLLLLSTSLMAFANAGKKPDPAESSNLKRLVDKHMVYPIFQKENMEGTVEVSFRIDNKGKLNILNIKASNPELVDYVVKKLKKIQLDQNDDSIGQTIKYRFVFKKQA